MTYCWKQGSQSFSHPCQDISMTFLCLSLWDTMRVKQLLEHSTADQIDKCIMQYFLSQSLNRGIVEKLRSTNSELPGSSYPLISSLEEAAGNISKPVQPSKTQYPTYHHKCMNVLLTVSGHRQFSTLHIAAIGATNQTLVKHNNNNSHNNSFKSRYRVHTILADFSHDILLHEHAFWPTTHESSIITA